MFIITLSPRVETGTRLASCKFRIPPKSILQKHFGIIKKETAEAEERHCVGQCDDARAPPDTSGFTQFHICEKIVQPPRLIAAVVFHLVSVQHFLQRECKPGQDSQAACMFLCIMEDYCSFFILPLCLTSIFSKPSFNSLNTSPSTQKVTTIF